MRKFTTVFLAVFAMISTVNAVDLQVKESGAGGAYTSISAAHTAANDGDRIIIETRSGGAAYIENITITKSVQLLSNVEGGLYKVQGDIDIVTTTPKEVTIIGMDITGNIIASSNGPSASRTNVRVLYSTVLGRINFDKNNFDVIVANCTINGQVTIRSGKIIGNTISHNTSNTVSIKTEATNHAPALSDTIQVVGNRISCLSNTYYAITASSDDHFYDISNNYIYYGKRGISIANFNSNTVGTDNINNNTFRKHATIGTSSFTIYLA